MNILKKTFNRYDERGYTDAVTDAEPAAVIEDDGIVVNEARERTQPSAFGGVNLGGSSIEMKVVRPERFDSVAAIADHLLNNRTVVLNLEATTKDIARRLIDFLSGVAYSIGGQIRRIANNTYIITPNNVDVSDSGFAAEAERADAEPEAETDEGIIE